MPKYDWSCREHRHLARARKLAISHADGHIGYIKHSEFYQAEVYFPELGSGTTRTYSQGSSLVTILDKTYEEATAQGGATNMNALYEVTKEDGSKVFATKMAEKSKTLWVMEIKGTGEFVAVETTNIQEVVPYTIQVKSVSNGGEGGHYEAEEGKFAVNNILVLNNGNIVTVVRLDTKQKGVSELKATGRINVTPL
jgi:hypothetical protein